MRNLTQQKQKKLAFAFFEYIENYKQENSGKYPKYSSNDKFYKDVFINLLICQEGLCAYTERFIFEEYTEYENPDYWKNGKFILKKPILDADIEHFIPKSKENLDWQWENLFLILPHVNRYKNNKEIPDYLKPDRPEYSPEKYFKYNFTTNRFVPNPELDKETKAQIKQALDDLGINSSETIRSHRRRTLNKYIQTMKLLENIKIDIKEYQTAFYFIKDDILSGKLSENLIKIK